jgi:hypothetical protein
MVWQSSKGRRALERRIGREHRAARDGEGEGRRGAGRCYTQVGWDDSFGKNKRKDRAVETKQRRPLYSKL